MPPPYDPTLKTLAELAPADWLPLAGRRRRRVTIEDSDIGTLVSGATDKLFRVHEAPPYLLHLDFQAGHDSAALPLRLRLYNSVFEDRHQLPVLSVAVLLHRGADSPQLTGRLVSGPPGEEPFSTLRYEVVRVWQIPAEQLLTGGLGTLALAPISAVSEGELPGVIRRMRERLVEPRARRVAREVWTASYILLGVRYSAQFATALFQEVLGMEESATYRAIIQMGRNEGRVEGRAEEARHMLLVLGEDKFGPPDEAIALAVQAITDVERLESLARQVRHAESWHQLLAPPARGRRRRSE
jgi:predicted transposase YdaD